jgi:hypothetical protein
LAIGRVFEIQVGDVLMAAGAVLPYITGAKIGWFLLSAFFAYVEIRHRHIPLTAVSTDIELMLESPSGDRATITRTQKLRANHENVTGFIRKIVSTGTVPKDQVEFSISHCAANRQKKEFDGTPSKWEVIHRFDPIPRNLLLLGMNTVKRTESVRIYDGFCSADESYEIEVPAMYRHDRIQMMILILTVSVALRTARPSGSATLASWNCR